MEARRLVAWFDGKFATEVTRNLLGEKIMKRMTGRGNPDGAAIRTGYLALRYHLEYLGWLAETRKWLAGSAISLADFTAAAHLSCLDFIGDVDWTHLAVSEGLVRPHEVTTKLPRRARRPRARHGSAGALHRPRFLMDALTRTCWCSAGLRGVRDRSGRRGGRLRLSRNRPLHDCSVAPGRGLASVDFAGAGSAWRRRPIC